ncbi:MAG TPA: radical SAM protein [Solirubrobacterales bacterium]|nr:radical SAM protein [Solirubrobacterales bacterium]
MRWDEQRVENDLRLPGVGDGTVVRTFDAPEAMGINFHEVRARSALNHVPGDRFGFRWTINPFRGCTHACAYCLSGDTPILMADGTTRPLAELKVGDKIYGTVRRGSYRRYGITQVEAHWATRKEAYRVELEDGTELIASGDHRFLTKRGWKYVTGAEQGPGQRPFLTTSNELLGLGALGPALAESEDYRLGYLCGMIRGDGHVGSYSYERPGRSSADVHRFRLALTDTEAVHRTRDFLIGAGVQTREFQFLKGSDRHRPMRGIRTSSKDGVDRVRTLIRWPRSPSSEWSRGFLAGTFDAEGGRNEALRICNKGPEILERTANGIRDLGFQVRLEKANSCGAHNVRLLGGLRQQMRLFQHIDPAITRKRSIAGIAIKSDAKLRVTSVEPLGRKMEMYDITTGTGDFIANGVVSHNCFARRTHNYLDFGPGEDFEREIVVKVNVPELLRAELKRPSWRRELVALGTNTDPYQWVESRYRFMPEILEALEAAETPVTVLTKSPLVLRDIDLFERMAEKVPVSVNLSVPTLDEAAWRATEPHTPSPAARLDAVAELRARGIESGVLVAPLMPGINDEPEQVQPILERAKAADASFLTGVALHLRGEVKDIFFGWLQEKRPDLLPRYEALYGNRAYMRPEHRKQATRALKGWGRSRRTASRQDAPRTGGADLGDHHSPNAGGGGTKSATGPVRRQAPVQQSFF